MNLSLLLCAALAHAPADKTAAELLARAEKAAAQGKFGVADTFYKRIVADFPDSDEVFLAEERLQPNTPGAISLTIIAAPVLPAPAPRTSRRYPPSAPRVRCGPYPGPEPDGR